MRIRYHEMKTELDTMRDWALSHPVGSEVRRKYRDCRRFLANATEDVGATGGTTADDRGPWKMLEWLKAQRTVRWQDVRVKPAVSKHATATPAINCPEIIARFRDNGELPEYFLLWPEQDESEADWDSGPSVEQIDWTGLEQA